MDQNRRTKARQRIRAIPPSAIKQLALQAMISSKLPSDQEAIEILKSQLLYVEQRSIFARKDGKAVCVIGQKVPGTEGKFKIVPVNKRALRNTWVAPVEQVF